MLFLNDNIQQGDICSLQVVVVSYHSDDYNKAGKNKVAVVVVAAAAAVVDDDDDEKKQMGPFQVSLD